jgi:hypothetical protein
MSIKNSVRVRGIGGTLELLFRRLVDGGKTPGYLISRAVDLERYDRAHNVETAGLVELEDLRIESANKEHGTRYGGMTPWRMRELLQSIPVEFSKATFIDFGSGKGAALFQASDFPFKKIVGVEFSPELHEVALKNLANFRSKTRRCSSIEAVCGDAGEFPFPEGPWVLFFNAPFGLPVWQRVMANLAGAPKGKGASYLIFANIGWHAGVTEFLDGLEFLRSYSSQDTSRIYEIT